MPSFKNETAGARTIRKIDGTYVLVEPGQAAFVAQGEIRKVTPGLVEFDDPDGPGEPPAALVECIADVPEMPAKLRAKVEQNDEKPAANMSLTKDELLAIAKDEHVDIETDDNKADLVRKINAARK